jgi:chromosome segregation ATPase
MSSNALQSLINAKASTDYKKLCAALREDIAKRKNAYEVAFSTKIQLTLPIELNFYGRCNTYNARLNKLQSDLSTSQQNITICDNAITSLKQIEATLTRQLKESDASLEDTARELSTVKSKLCNSLMDYERVVRELSAVKSNTAQACDEKNRTIAELQHDNDVMNKQLAIERNWNVDLTHQMEGIARELRDALAQLAIKQNSNVDLTRQLSELSIVESNNVDYSKVGE